MTVIVRETGETRVRVELLAKRSPMLFPASARSTPPDRLRSPAVEISDVSSSRLRSETARKSRFGATGPEVYENVKMAVGSLA